MKTTDYKIVLSHFYTKCTERQRTYIWGKSVRIYFKILLWLLLCRGMIVDFYFLLYTFSAFPSFFFSMRVYYFHDWKKNPIKLFLETSSRLVPGSFLYINIVAFLPKKGMVLPVFHDRFQRLTRRFNHGCRAFRVTWAALHLLAQWLS